MSGSWPLVDASSWTLAGIERQGLHQHWWYRNEFEPRTWLFKPARATRERAIGEEVAEKLASELAGLIGVPAARVELAMRGQTRGALVEDARPPNWDLQLGRVVLSEVLEHYDPDDRGHRGYAPPAIQAALRRFGPPPGSDVPPSFGAFDVFAGYLAFDALIAHGDRHDRNWAVLVAPPGHSTPDALCASFDHAASLGFTLSPAACAEHLRLGTVRRWACSGRAQRFEHVPGLPRQTLVELAGAALRLCHDATVRHWQERIASVDRDSVEAIVEAAESLSDVTKEFVVELLMVNRGRLGDELA